MKKLVLLLAFLNLLSASNLFSQKNNVKKSYFKDKVVSIERWYGNNDELDSIQTYHKSGNKHETFYYLKNRKHGECFKYNDIGEKTVSWFFNQGKLTKRVDYESNISKKDAPQIKARIKKLHELYNKRNYNINHYALIQKQGNLRYQIGDMFLAKESLLKIERFYKKRDEENKPIIDIWKADLYNKLGGIFAYYQKENAAIHYRNLSIEKAPENYVYKYNMASYLYGIKDYRLAISYANEFLKKSKNHSFSNRLLAAIYADLEEYDKAFSHINVAFKGEEDLFKNGFAGIERNIRTIRGLLYHRLGESEKGIKDLKEALELIPSNSFAYKNLGIIYNDLGEFDKSCNYFQKAKDLNYTKKHDRNDLEAFLESACSNEEIVFSGNLNKKPYLYPNPTKGIVNIKNFDSTNFEFKIYNYKSQLKQEGVSKKNNFDLSNLTNGLYILKILDLNSKKTYSFRIIKE